MPKVKTRDMDAVLLVGKVRALHVEIDKFNKEFIDSTYVAKEAFQFFTEKLIAANNVLLTRWED